MKLAYGLGMLDDMSLEEFEYAAKTVSEIGYDGLEPSVCSPATLDKEGIKAILDKYGLQVRYPSPRKHTARGLHDERVL